MALDCPSVVLALGLLYATYYSHFHDVYARTLSRVGTEGAETSLVATLAEHSESKPVTMLRFLVNNYGWATLVLAAVGRSPRSGATGDRGGR